MEMPLATQMTGNKPLGQTAEHLQQKRLSSHGLSLSQVLRGADPRAALDSPGSVRIQHMHIMENSLKPLESQVKFSQSLGILTGALGR